MNLKIFKCKRCDHQWCSDIDKFKENNNEPYQCPKCKSARWKIPKK